MTLPKRTEKRKTAKTEQSEKEVNLQLPTRQLPSELERILFERIRLYVKWTEKAEVEMKKTTEFNHGGSLMPFSVVLRSKIKNSVAGQFLNIFNQGNITQKEQDYKLFLAKFTLKKNEFPSSYSRENDYADNLINIIESLVTSERKGRISLTKFLRSLNHLRLCSCKIGFIDRPMYQLSQLQVLSLPRNSINIIPFEWLPTKLQFLELSGNIISDIMDTENAPPYVTYLGLSNNIFNDRSDISGLLSMRCLVYLDLSDNDFCCVDDLLNDLSHLQRLTGLSLKGNPCSVTIGYVWKVLKRLPNLTYLDGKSLKDLVIDEGKLKEESQTVLNSGKLQIHVYRIMGLPRTGKRSRGYYEIELHLPLLDEELKERLRLQVEEELQDRCNALFSPFEESRDITSSESSAEEMEKDSAYMQTSTERRVSLRKKSLVSNYSEIEKKPRISAPWKIPYANFLINDLDSDVEGLTKMRSEKLFWNNIMKPKNPIIEIMVPPENIIDLRDTLRSIITLKLYYNETLTRKKGDRRSVKVPSLVAKIPIPAEIPLWYEDYKGYNWEIVNFCSAKSFPGIGEIKFAVGGKGMPRNGDVKTAVFPPPTHPTCHVGISLQRYIK